MAGEDRTCVGRLACGGQRTPFRSGLSPPTMWVMGIKLRYPAWQQAPYLLSHLAGPWLAFKKKKKNLANDGAEKNIRVILNGDVSGSIFSSLSLGAKN